MFFLFLDASVIVMGWIDLQVYDTFFAKLLQGIKNRGLIFRAHSASLFVAEIICVHYSLTIIVLWVVKYRYLTLKDFDGR